jgi:hypothetical protein
MPPAYEVLLLNTAVPQIQAAQSGDTYVVPRDIAINATAIISANSATDALRITQTGAGNALVVEDSANPDATPFVVTAAGDVGIGTTSPGAKLEVAVSGSSQQLRMVSTGNSILRTRWIDATSGFTLESNNTTETAYYPFTLTGSVLRFNTGAGSLAATLDASGNLGLGVTPSGWSGIGNTLQVNTGGSFSADAANAYFAANSYYNGTNWIYQTTNNATRYTMAANSHLWYTAPSGTAGNAITFTQAMTLDASGRLLIGQTADKTQEVMRVSGSGQASLLLDNTGKTNGAFVGAFNDAALLGVNRNPSTGVFYNTSNYAAGIVLVGSSSTSYIAFETAAAANTIPTERARITSGGNFQTSSGNSVQVGGTAARATTAGTNRVDIFDGTAPVGTLANGVSFYSAAGEASVMDAAGNATLLSPHDSETNEWIFRSKHTPSGKVLKIDVEKMLRFINDHFGLDAIHEFTEE